FAADIGVHVRCYRFAEPNRFGNGKVGIAGFLTVYCGGGDDAGASHAEIDYRHVIEDGSVRLDRKSMKLADWVHADFVCRPRVGRRDLHSHTHESAPYGSGRRVPSETSAVGPL